MANAATINVDIWKNSLANRVETLRDRMRESFVSAPDKGAEPLADTQETVTVNVSAGLAKFFICENVDGTGYSWGKRKKVYSTVKVTDYQADRGKAIRYGTIVARFECFDAGQARAKFDRDRQAAMPVRSQGKVGYYPANWAGDY